MRRKSKQKDVVDAKNEVDEQLNGGAVGGDSDAEVFEIEESDTPLIPLYQLRDEGTTKWVLLSDLCYLLKVKSKDTLLKMVSAVFGHCSVLLWGDLRKLFNFHSFQNIAVPWIESNIECKSKRSIARIENVRVSRKGGLFAVAVRGRKAQHPFIEGHISQVQRKREKCSWR